MTIVFTDSPEIDGETEMDLEHLVHFIDQSSVPRGTSRSKAAKKVIDGRCNDTNFLGDGGEMFGGSCTVTGEWLFVRREPNWLFYFEMS